MKRFFALLATLFALALSFGGCAEADDLSVGDESAVAESTDAIVSEAEGGADYERNELGGRIWTWAEVVAEGAENGVGFEANDECVDCCMPGVCTPICCGSEGGGSGGGGGTAGGGSGGPYCPTGRCYKNCKYIQGCHIGNWP